MCAFPEAHRLVWVCLVPDELAEEPNPVQPPAFLSPH